MGNGEDALVEAFYLKLWRLFCAPQCSHQGETLHEMQDVMQDVGPLSAPSGDDEE